MEVKNIPFYPLLRMYNGAVTLEKHIAVFENIKQSYLFTQQLDFLVKHTLRRMENISVKKHTEIFMAVLFTIVTK